MHFGHLPAHSSDKSLTFFCDKISKIRDAFSTSGCVTDSPSLATPAFNAFDAVSEDEIQKIINGSPIKSCLLDPIATFLLKDCLNILLLSIAKLVKDSLSEGSFLDVFKKAVVNPLIKKALLLGKELKNYCPVSYLCLLSKLVEWVVAKQLTAHINSNKLINPLQSAYKSGHFTETALLSIKNEIQLFLGCTCSPYHFSRKVLTLSPPTSEIRVHIPAQNQVGKLVVACHWSAIYSTKP